MVTVDAGSLGQTADSDMITSTDIGYRTRSSGPIFYLRYTDDSYIQIQDR